MPSKDIESRSTESSYSCSLCRVYRHSPLKNDFKYKFVNITGIQIAVTMESHLYFYWFRKIRNMFDLKNFMISTEL